MVTCMCLAVIYMLCGEKKIFVIESMRPICLLNMCGPTYCPIMLQTSSLNYFFMAQTCKTSRICVGVTCMVLVIYVVQKRKQFIKISWT